MMMATSQLVSPRSWFSEETARTGLTSADLFRDWMIGAPTTMGKGFGETIVWEHPYGVSHVLSRSGQVRKQVRAHHINTSRVTLGLPNVTSDRLRYEEADQRLLEWHLAGSPRILP